MRKSSLDPKTLEQIFAFICRHWEQHHYGPSLREIASECYLSRTNLYRYLDKLEVEGRILRDANVARGIILLKPCQR